MIALEVVNRQRKRTLTREMRNALDAVAKALCQELGMEAAAEASVSFVSDGPIRALNRQERGVDAPTDVLSFPNLEFPAGREGDLGQAADWDRNPETGRIMLGDIIISLERAYEQAQAYGHGPLREVAFLRAHGLLHLLGYDHVEGEEPMFSIQNAVLNRANITREV